MVQSTDGWLVVQRPFQNYFSRITNHRSMNFRPQATSNVQPLWAEYDIPSFEMAILYFYLDILGVLKGQTSSACALVRSNGSKNKRLCAQESSLHLKRLRLLHDSNPGR